MTCPRSPGPPSGDSGNNNNHCAEPNQNTARTNDTGREVQKEKGIVVMKKEIIRHVIMSVGVQQFLANHPFDPVIPEATVLSAELNSVIAGLQAKAGEQASGKGAFSGGSDERVLRALELRDVLRDMARTARAL